MGKAIIFITIFLSLNTVEAKNYCSTAFLSKNAVELTPQESQKIKWFYDSKPSHGYVSEGSDFRWIDRANRLKPDKRIIVPYQDGRLVAFHRLRKGIVGQNFAAVAGVGVVNIKLIDARTTAQFDRYLKAKLKLIEFFQEHGFVNSSIMYMDHFFSKAVNKWVVVSWYNPGISHNQLEKFLKGHELKKAHETYEDFVKRVAHVVENSNHTPIKYQRLSVYLKKYAIYFDKQWSLSLF